MPTSHPALISRVASLIEALAPRSVLDIGCGAGKYGVLAREYTDLIRGRIHPAEWQTSIEGIEPFEPYLSPIHAWAYTRIHRGTAQAVLPTMGLAMFDLVLAIDVIEHMDRRDGLHMIRWIVRHSLHALVATPRLYQEQGPENGNEMERHRCPWPASRLRRFGVVSEVEGGNGILVLER